MLQLQNKTKRKAKPDFIKQQQQQQQQQRSND